MKIDPAKTAVRLETECAKCYGTGLGIYPELCSECLGQGFLIQRLPINEFVSHLQVLINNDPHVLSYHSPVEWKDMP